MAHHRATPGAFDRVASECIAARVRLINRVITALYDEALRPYGVRVSQGNIMTVVGHLGEEARPAAICRILRIDRSTLSRDVELLKRSGWLESDPPGGGRKQVLRVTAEGRRLLAAALPAWEKAQDEARQILGDGGAEAIHRIAGRLGLGPPEG